MQVLNLLLRFSTFKICCTEEWLVKNVSNQSNMSSTHGWNSITQEGDAEVNEPVLEEKLPQARMKLLPKQRSDRKA